LVVLAAYLLVQAAMYWLEILNIRHARKHVDDIPADFGGQTNKALMERSVAYTIDRTMAGIAESAAGSAVLIIFLFSGLLDHYNAWIISLKLPFIPSGLLFFMVLSLCSTLLSVPFSLYRAFRIENRYGFNTMTMKLWINDFLKSALLSAFLLIVVTSAGLWIVLASPGLWWLLLWGFFLCFSLLLMYVSPSLIEPLFNTFTPIAEKELAVRIRELAGKAGIHVSRILKVDASKRSHHTNAYFTGIGRVKRIVLFDTLLNKMDDGEIIAVLAHEIGHWKKRHIVKRIIALEVLALAGIYGSFLLLQGDLLTGIFGVRNGTFFSGVVILSFLAGIASFPLAGISNYLSRRNEEEADRFAVEATGDSEGLAASLIKLSKDNLSNLHPHPWYAAFNYSHPPVVERINRIRSMKK